MAGSGYKIAVLIIIQADSLLPPLRLFCKYAVTLSYFYSRRSSEIFLQHGEPGQNAQPFQ